MNFTYKQRKAIEHFTGPALVLAVPGAGKTTVLLHRIKYLKDFHGVDPKNILSITFSKSQARDMEMRFKRLFPELKESYFSTIHSFCYYIIKLYYDRNNRIFKMIESSGPVSKFRLIKNIMNNYSSKAVRDDQVDNFLQDYGYCKNMMIEDKLSKRYSLIFEKVYRDYENFKREHFLLDFDDLLTKSYEILEKDSYILNRIKRRYEFIQLDEGQDTSKIQLAIISKLASPENNIFILADDDQSIYSFRGANPSYLLDFQKIYPEAKLYYIDQNFRSTEKIVKLSNKVIRDNKKRYPKDIYTDNKDKDLVKVAIKKDFLASFSYIKDNLRKDKKTAIIYRRNISSLALIKYLDIHQIPFHLSYQKDSLFNSFILDDILNIIAFSENNTSMDLFRKIYYKLNSYIKKTSLNHIETYDMDMPIWDRLLDDSNLSRFYVDRFLELKLIFKRIQKAKGKNKIDMIMDDIGYREYVSEKISFENQHISLEQIIEIYKYIFETCEAYEDFISEIGRLKKIQKNSYKKTSNLSLMTVHSSKGLEFDDVFVIDLVDGEFPMNLDASDDKFVENYEEERRMFYVAITRAKENLYLLAPKSRNTRRVKLSDFLKDSQKYLEEIEKDRSN